MEKLELMLTGGGAAVVAIVFAVRKAQCQVRKKAITAIRHTLDDLVRNKLQVVLFATEIKDQDWRPAAQRAVQEIQISLNRIEAEAITDIKAR